MNELHGHKQIVTYLTKTLKWLLYDITRNAFQAIKTSKEGSPKVFNKYTKSYFSMDVPLIRKTSVCIFLRRALGWLLLTEIQIVTEPIKSRNRAVLGKYSIWKLNVQNISSMKSNALCLRLSEPTAWLAA